jgi:hypothetical protein
MALFEASVRLHAKGVVTGVRNPVILRLVAEKVRLAGRINLLGWFGVRQLVGALQNYGSGGAGLSVPRSRLNTDDGNHSGIASSLAALSPITSITAATVRGPVQSQSG